MTKADGKIIITGSGRSGTTFLAHLFTALGFDTGYALKDMDNLVSVLSGGGLEWPIRGKKTRHPIPRVIKDPALCYDLLDRASRWEWDIERVYVSIRKFDEVADHMIHRNMRRGKCLSLLGGLEGETRETEMSFVKSLSYEQEKKLIAWKYASRVGYLMEQLLDSDIPYTLVAFPRSALDWRYCMHKLSDVMTNVTEDAFMVAHESVSKADMIRWSPKEEK